MPRPKRKNMLRTKFKNAKQAFLEWSNKADINCWSKIIHYNGNYFIQILWLKVLIFSTIATFFLISKSIIDYLKYDVTSQIEIYNDIPAKFPTVTFCDNNPFKTKKAQELMDSIVHRYNMSRQIDSFDLAKNYAASKLVSNKFRKSLGSMENLECIFLKVSLNCSHDLHWYWSHEFGNCYQFNFDPLMTRHVYRVGKNYGFKNIFLNKNKHVTTRAKGLAVFVHNASFKPTNDAKYIEPGKMTLISVDRVFTQKYPSLYSDCIDTRNFFFFNFFEGSTRNKMLPKISYLDRYKCLIKTFFNFFNTFDF
jgi:hypothetical protein